MGRDQNLVDNEPSPYVGHIDLQHSLLASGRRRSRERSPVNLTGEESDSVGIGQTDNVDDGTRIFAVRLSKKRRRISPSILVPQGGSYRIPLQGQLQIIIKNPNKTAVKLFLVPYDLTGMEAGTKTFIRQRCYSTDPLKESLISTSPSDSLDVSNLQGMTKKKTLRYLIHLNVCSPSRGRFYLYQHIRVVFANRVPDNKEQLQNEIQIPQPRYSVYKPTWDTLPGSISGAGVRLAAEKAYRRRSSGFEPLRGYSSQPFIGSSNITFGHGTPTPPIPSIPLKFDLSNYQDHPEPDERISDSMSLDTPHFTTVLGMQASSNDTINQFPTTISSSYKSSSTNSSEGYGKLSKGDSGYGGVFGRPGTPEVGEGLLARKLKGLGVRREEGQRKADQGVGSGDGGI